MKKYISWVMLALVLLTSFGIMTSPVYAYAYDTDFESVVHIQNIGTDTAVLSIDVIDDLGTTNYPIADIPIGGSTSLLIGTLGLGSEFKGSAVLKSNQPLATVVSQSSTGDVKNQPLTSGFSVGSSSVLIPTVLKNKFFVHSIFSVQNVDENPADLKYTFVPLLGDYPNYVAGTPIIYEVEDLPSNTAHFVDMGNFAPITDTSFNGSVFIEAKEANSDVPGSIVASSMELEFAGNNAYGFDGALATANKIFLPSAQCNFGPRNNETTSYAVSNPNNFPVDVKVTYSNGIVDGPYTLAPYAKRSFDGCHAGNPRGFLGSAIVESMGGENIHAVSKIYGGGLYPAHLGFTNGSSKVALPYVRWTDDNWLNGTGFRSYIAVQNIGTTDIPSGDVTVKYYNKDGQLVGTHELGEILVGKKANSHAWFVGEYEFGSDGGGSAVVEGPIGSQLAVVVRVQKYIGDGKSVGEDYTGIPIN
jgi:hypothetical protein